VTVPIELRLLGAVLLAVAPASPPAEAAARLKSRLLRRTAAPANAEGFVEMRRDDRWRDFVGGTQMKVLHDDGRTMSWLVRMPPGTRLPPHRHDDGLEECLVLEGEVIVNGERYRAGDYLLAPPGSEHDDVHSDAGAVFYLRSPSPRRAAARPASA